MIELSERVVDCSQGGPLLRRACHGLVLVGFGRRQICVDDASLQAAAKDVQQPSNEVVQVGEVSEPRVQALVSLGENTKMCSLYGKALLEVDANIGNGGVRV